MSVVPYGVEPCAFAERLENALWLSGQHETKKKVELLTGVEPISFHLTKMASSHED